MSDSSRRTAEASQKGDLAHRLTRVAAVMGMIAAVVGVAHLAAWLGGYMTQRGLTAIIMKTNTALCLTSVGVALMLLVPPEGGLARRWTARICAVSALLVGLLTLVENLSGWDFGIDQLLAVETPGALAVASPNRMGTPASLSFTLIGLALLIFSRRDHRGVRVMQALALAVCLIALLPTVGFLYGAEQFYGIAQYTGIAWPTAVALLLMGLALLCARPAEGLMSQVTANDPGGVNIRRLLPAFVILPLLLGWLCLAGERAWIFDAATVIPSLALVDVWQWTPMVTLIVLAGLAAIPGEPYESAHVDGANEAQILWHITIPMVLPTVFTAMVLRSVDALKTFDIIYAMTGGGPGYASETLNVMGFKYSFEYFRLGQASVILVFLFIVVLAVSLGIVRLRVRAEQ